MSLLPKDAAPDDPKLPPLALPDGTTLHSIKFTSDLFLNKTTAIWGSSNTGKTLIADNILYVLRKRIPSVIGFLGSPNATNGIQKHFPPGSFTNKLTFENFTAIAARMVDMAKVYDKVNNVPALKRFVEKYVSNTSYRQDLSDITYKMNRSINDVRAQYASVSDVESKIQKIKDLTTVEVRNILKRVIYKNRAEIIKYKESELSEEDTLILYYVYYVPNLLCMIDDMTSTIIKISKKKKEGEQFQEIFTQGRWWYFTLVILIHADNNITPEIKKGMFINIFTEATQVNHYFETKSLSFPKHVVKEALKFAEFLYNSWKTHYRCLVYIRGDPYPFRYYVGNQSISLNPFVMGSDNFKKLCHGLHQKKEVFGINNNPSLSSFKKTINSKKKINKPRPHEINPVRL